MACASPSWQNGWTITDRVVAYDHAKAAATARRHGRNDWAHWLETGTA